MYLSSPPYFLYHTSYARPLLVESVSSVQNLSIQKLCPHIPTQNINCMITLSSLGNPSPRRKARRCVSGLTGEPKETWPAWISAVERGKRMVKMLVETVLNSPWMKRYVDITGMRIFTQEISWFLEILCSILLIVRMFWDIFVHKCTFSGNIIKIHFHAWDKIGIDFEVCRRVGSTIIFCWVSDSFELSKDLMNEHLWPALA